MLHAVGGDGTARRPGWVYAAAGVAAVLLVVACAVAYRRIAGLDQTVEVGDALLAVGVAGGIALVTIAAVAALLWQERRRRADARAADHDGDVAALRAEVASMKQAEAALQEARVFLDLVIENIPAMVFAKDAKDHRFLIVNRAGEELLGIGRAELIGKSDYDFFPKEQADHFVQRDREVFVSGAIQDTPEEPITTRDKGVRLLHTRKVPVPDEQGRPKFLLALIEDITERRRAEVALQASEEMFRSLLAASPDAMTVIDRDGRIFLASRRVEAMFGYAPEELAGKRFDALLPERFREASAARLRSLADSPASGAASQEVCGLRKDGSEFPAEISISPNQTAGGLAAIAAIRDITRRKGTEIQLRQAQKMEAVGQLTGGMAHDFNNLLTIVIGNLDLLADEVEADPRARDLARSALTASLKGAELTRQLLAFSRRQPLEPTVFAANQLVAGTTELLRRTLGERIEVRTRLADDLWPALADPAQVESVLANLAINARDAMPNGGSLTIETANQHLDEGYAVENAGVVPGDYVMLAVSDTGTGMPPEVLERVFEPFFTTKAEGKGTGLGLSMVYGFARQSGGHVKIYSEVGHGTTIRFYLPRAGRELPAAPGDAVAVPDAPVPAASILVVEDNPGVRRVVVQQLAGEGYKILEAGSAEAALHLIAQGLPIDLLFTDVVMPGAMTGEDPVRAARQQRPGLKVLFTSGFAEIPNRDGSRQREIRRDNLLSKPYRKRDLIRRIHEALHAEADPS